MAKRKRSNNHLQNIHIKNYRSSKRNPTKNRGWTQVLRKGNRWSLLHFFVQRQYIYRHYVKLFGLFEICAIEIRRTKKQKSPPKQMG
jgi:hypothetical protein